MATKEYPPPDMEPFRPPRPVEREHRDFCGDCHMPIAVVPGTPEWCPACERNICGSCAPKHSTNEDHKVERYFCDGCHKEVGDLKKLSRCQCCDEQVCDLCQCNHGV